MGDFNLPDINWEHHTDGTTQVKSLLKNMDDNFREQVLREPTQKDAILPWSAAWQQRGSQEHSGWWPSWPRLSWVNAAAPAKAQQGNHPCCCSLLLLSGPQCALLHEVIPMQNLSLQHLSFKQEDFLSLCFLLFSPNFSCFESCLSSLDPDLSLVAFLLV